MLELSRARLDAVDGWAASHTPNAYGGGQMSQVGWMFTDYGGVAQRISQQWRDSQGGCSQRWSSESSQWWNGVALGYRTRCWWFGHEFHVSYLVDCYEWPIGLRLRWRDLCVPIHGSLFRQPIRMQFRWAPGCGSLIVGQERWDGFVAWCHCNVGLNSQVSCG